MSFAEFFDDYSFNVIIPMRRKRILEPSRTLMLSYPSGLCDTVIIARDRLLEGNEDFIVSIFADDVFELPQPSTVIIQDSDSKY